MGLLIRGAIVALGVVTMLGGLASIILVPEVGVAGLWTVGIGAFLVIVPLIERNRYRSEAAEKRNESPGPGGGEAPGSALEPRFRPTAEVFVDPTTGHRMRVLVDPRTGERRYVAEG
ncbi:MAG: hypothetical protein A2V84_04050 [Chloroflexi bacterium RBG_16_70_13]|nr:MAG: hypothetical protein A2V84_04050 [Chloroflexi bacterium RBG_16_70_13]